jgi:hypothetical protein
MSTAAQILANRTNAQQSTGPTTEAGKATSSRNSLKHGLASSQLIIPGESQSAFDAFEDALISEHRPSTPTEMLLVQDMAKYHWLLDRALSMQSTAIGMEHGLVPATLAVLIRYQTANQRAFDNAFATLLSLKKQAAKDAIGSAPQKAAKPAVNPAPTAPKTAAAAHSSAFQPDTAG